MGLAVVVLFFLPWLDRSPVKSIVITSYSIHYTKLYEMKDSVQQAASEFETSMNEDLRKAESDLNRSVAEAAGEPVAGPAPETPDATAALDKPDAPEAHGASR